MDIIRVIPQPRAEQASRLEANMEYAKSVVSLCFSVGIGALGAFDSPVTLPVDSLAPRAASAVAFCGARACRHLAQPAAHFPR